MQIKPVPINFRIATILPLNKVWKYDVASTSYGSNDNLFLFYQIYIYIYILNEVAAVF